MKPLLVIGSSGHAGPVLESIELQGEYEVIGLLDSFEPVGTKKRDTKFAARRKMLQSFQPPSAALLFLLR